ncbi:9050_t:CDS:2 [Ambispora gerdemannii]|uniref:9050_t:CDS:1 n=1 Tax=Ambispora gerdemannii TaxID=144530 RepID=A0A9N9A831_9GLOM|nr:9050_t:CDS:2 [Ambispora gerdemannii]
MHGAKKLLTSNIWKQLQQASRTRRVIIFEKSETERAVKDQQQIMNELMEKIRDLYLRVKKREDPEQTVLFIEKLKNELGVIKIPTSENRYSDGIGKYLRASCERIGYRDRNRFSSTDYDDDDDDDASDDITDTKDTIKAIEVLSSD